MSHVPWLDLLLQHPVSYVYCFGVAFGEIL